MPHDHDWWYAWENEDGCICGSCGDTNKPYLWCEYCDKVLTPKDPEFRMLWEEIHAK
jgi:hypothetical protein